MWRILNDTRYRNTCTFAPEGFLNIALRGGRRRMISRWGLSRTSYDMFADIRSTAGIRSVSCSKNVFVKIKNRNYDSKKKLKKSWWDLLDYNSTGGKNDDKTWRLLLYTRRPLRHGRHDTNWCPEFQRKESHGTRVQHFPPTLTLLVDELIALTSYDLLWSLAISGSQLTFFFMFWFFIIIIAFIFPCCGRYLGVTAGVIIFMVFLIIAFVFPAPTRGRFYIRTLRIYIHT